MRPSLVLAVPVALAATLLALILAAAWWGMPLPAGDQDWFLPVASLWAAGEGLQHPFISPIPDTPGLAYTWHGWLMPVVQGLAAGPGYADQLWPPALLMAGLVVVWVWLVRPAGRLMTALALPVLLCLFNYQIGRPELVASALMLLLPLGWAWPGGRFALTLIAITLLAVTSLTLAISVGLLDTLLLSATLPLRRLALRQAGLALLAVGGAVALTLIVTDTAPGDWATGLRAHAAMIAARTDSQDLRSLLHFLVLQPMMPGIAALLALFALWIAPRLRVGVEGACALLLLGWLVWTALRIPPTIYNFTAIVPLLLVLIARHPPRLALPCLATAAVATSLSLAGTGWAAVTALRGGVGPEPLRAALRSLPPEAVVETGSIALAMIVREELGAARVRHSDRNTGSDWRLTAQAYSGRAAPDLPPGHCVIATNFHEERKDWAFALTCPCPPG